jgi:hypothetical protein
MERIPFARITAKSGYQGTRGAGFVCSRSNSTCCTTRPRHCEAIRDHALSPHLKPALLANLEVDNAPIQRPLARHEVFQGPALWARLPALAGSVDTDIANAILEEAAKDSSRRSQLPQYPGYPSSFL